MDWRSRESGNLCIELEALNHSRSPVFVYGLPYGRKIYIHAFDRSELYDLTRRTKMTEAGRFYTYRHLRVGDQQNNEGVLVPKSELHKVGQPFGQAIRALTKQAL